MSIEAAPLGSSPAQLRRPTAESATAKTQVTFD
jgi:hypothetical protein